MADCYLDVLVDWLLCNSKSARINLLVDKMLVVWSRISKILCYTILLYVHEHIYNATVKTLTN